MEQRRNQINTNRGKIMKNTLISVAILTLVSLPSSAGMLGVDWEASVLPEDTRHGARPAGEVLAHHLLRRRGSGRVGSSNSVS